MAKSLPLVKGDMSVSSTRRQLLTSAPVLALGAGCTTPTNSGPAHRVVVSAVADTGQELGITIEDAEQKPLLEEVFTIAPGHDRRTAVFQGDPVMIKQFVAGVEWGELRWPQSDCGQSTRTGVYFEYENTTHSQERFDMWGRCFNEEEVGSTVTE